MIELRKAPQEGEMVFAPGDDVVKIVAGSYGGAGHQQQNLLERIHHPPRLAVIPEFGEMLQKQAQSRPRGVLVGGRDGDGVHDRAPCRIRASRESRSSSQYKITRKCPLT